ncbi:MAG: hypothetical protein BJ554DRAFT_101 [Olpidium bornovanus]|uniref:Complex III subunit 9 n=1 Tax=Olpidium bornovanus TaxID=278681 RepID=A0A8H7ZU05_9FUNG|nr:MAG: hypothetical protein BJ554DRAFT_101 [Olpidium bornovanus]
MSYGPITRTSDRWSRVLFRRVFKRNANFVTACFASAFVFEIFYDDACGKLWRHWNKGVSFKELPLPSNSSLEKRVAAGRAAPGNLGLLSRGRGALFLRRLGMSTQSPTLPRAEGTSADVFVQPHTAGVLQPVAYLLYPFDWRLSLTLSPFIFAVAANDTALPRGRPPPIRQAVKRARECPGGERVPAFDCKLSAAAPPPSKSPVRPDRVTSRVP